MKNSYTQHIRKEQAGTRRQVMSLLRWNETQYADYQYRQGTAYLQSYISNDPQGIDMLVASRIFWAWWRNQWMIRDRQFLDSKVSRLNHITTLSIYLNLHNADALVSHIYPSGAVLEDSYAQMIGNVIKSNV